MAGLIEVTFTFPQGGKHEEPLVMSFPRACLDDVDPDSQSMFAAKLSFLRLGKENKGKGKGKGKASDSGSSSSASKKRKRDADDDTAETVKLTIETKADSGTYYIPEACQFVIEAIRAFPEPVVSEAERCRAHDHCTNSDLSPRSFARTTCPCLIV